MYGQGNISYNDSQAGNGGAFVSLTTVGTAGAATLIGGVLNIPNYGAAAPVIPSWDQTLTVNDTTSQKWVYAQAALSTGQWFEWITPKDYNPATNRDRYSRWFDDTFSNPSSGRHDVVAGFWSYNMGAAESVTTAGEAAFAFITESFYEQDSTTLSEFHLPIFVDNTGVYHRLWSMYTHRPTGYTYLQSQISSLAFRRYWDNSGATDWLDFGSGDVEGTHVGVGASMNLSSAGAASGTPVLIRITDSDGGSLSLQSVGTNVHIFGGTDMFIQPARTLYLQNYVQFSLTNFFADGQTYLQSCTNAVNKGFEFYTAGQTVRMFSMWQNQNLSWVNLRVVASAEVDGRLGVANAGVVPVAGAWLTIGASAAAAAQINLLTTGVTVTVPNVGDLWAFNDTLPYHAPASGTVDLMRPGIDHVLSTPDPLTANRTSAWVSFNWVITGSRPTTDGMFSVNNTNIGNGAFAIVATTINGAAVYGVASDSGVGGSFSSVNSTGLSAASVAGYGLTATTGNAVCTNFNSNFTTNNAVGYTVQIANSGTVAAIGYGVGISFTLHSAGVVDRFAGWLDYSWLNPADTTFDSVCTIRVAHNGTGPVDGIRIKGFQGTAIGVFGISHDPPVYANNAAAIAGALVAGDVYRNSVGAMSIVF